MCLTRHVNPQSDSTVSVLNKNIPGGTILLLAILVGPIVWLLATQDTDEEKSEKEQAAFVAQIPKSGTLGRWYDDIGSKSYGDSTITILTADGRYLAQRVSGDGSKTKMQISPEDGSTYAFTVDKDKFGARYVITPGGLEIHDRTGYIRTAMKVN